MVEINAEYMTGTTATTFMLNSVVLTMAVTTSFTGTNCPPVQPPVLSEQLHPWETTGFSATETTTEMQLDWRSALTEFGAQMVENMVEPIPEFDAIISENFWELA